MFQGYNDINSFSTNFNKYQFGYSKYNPKTGISSYNNITNSAYTNIEYLEPYTQRNTSIYSGQPSKIYNTFYENDIHQFNYYQLFNEDIKYNNFQYIPPININNSQSLMLKEKTFSPEPHIVSKNKGIKQPHEALDKKDYRQIKTVKDLKKFQGVPNGKNNISQQHHQVKPNLLKLKKDKIKYILLHKSKIDPKIQPKDNYMGKKGKLKENETKSISTQTEQLQNSIKPDNTSNQKKMIYEKKKAFAGGKSESQLLKKNFNFNGFFHHVNVKKINKKKKNDEDIIFETPNEEHNDMDRDLNIPLFPSNFEQKKHNKLLSDCGKELFQKEDFKKKKSKRKVIPFDNLTKTFSDYDIFDLFKDKKIYLTTDSNSCENLKYTVGGFPKKNYTVLKIINK